MIKTYEFNNSKSVSPAIGSLTEFTFSIAGVNITIPPFLDVPPNADTRYSVEGVIMRRGNEQVWTTGDMTIKGFSIFLQGVKR